MNIWKNRDWEPMLLKEVDKPFDSNDYFFELKFDGQRAIIFASKNKVVIKNRHKQDITYLYPELQNIKNIVKGNTIFDGEIVYLENGIPSFSKLQERFLLKNKLKIKRISLENPITFVCFDILYEKKDLRELTLSKRKRILDRYKDSDVFVKNLFINEKGIKLYKKIKKLGLEGIVAKKKTSPYLISERSENWVKIKNFKRGIFYIGGFILKDSSNTISLALGEYNGNDLFFVGKVSMSKKDLLYNKLIKLKVNKKTSFADYKEDINYIIPKYKVEVLFMERTKNNHLRQPIYQKEINN